MAAEVVSMKLYPSTIADFRQWCKAHRKTADEALKGFLSREEKGGC